MKDASTGAYSNNTGTYQLSIDSDTVSPPPPPPSNDDYSSNTGTTGRLNVGGLVTGNIELANDTDWFRISLNEGTTYTIDLEGLPTNSGTLSDTYLRGIYNSNGSLISQTTNDDGGVSVNSQLGFTPTTSGDYYISTGAYSNNTGTYQLSIIEEREFDIVINYDGNNQFIQQALDVAENHWENIIIGDLPNVEDAILGTIDDLVIDVEFYVETRPNALAQGGIPSGNIRDNNNGLPFHGVLRIPENFSDTENMNTNNDHSFEDVFIHEIGHSLGFFSEIFEIHNLLNENGDYIGEAALHQYQNIAGDNSLTFIPLNGGHFDEDTFDTEIMTPFADSEMPTSVITIGVLDDLGYSVNYNAADSYFL